ncbi:MAG: NADH-quinone oxidoreductase subunit C [Anaerolineaceae bacterium]|nr:NADH-quinone oxidoreductase subunit C [Anaerolineaceae bacterium]
MTELKEATIDTSSYLQKAEQALAVWSMETTHPEDFRLDVRVSADDLLKASQCLLELDRYYLSTITGLDNLKPVDPKAPTAAAVEGAAAPDDSLEALYHFSYKAAVVTLRVKVPRAAPTLPTICGLIPSVSLYEREAMDMFGFEIIGTPDTSRLLLADDWPEGVYPLRKDFTGLKKPVAGKKGK